MSSPSRLSSLLVRDGIVGVKRMEQAFQRQVIYGGALDTILLEMSILAEDRLAEYLSLATGLPPADRDQLAYFDPRAAQICSREQAESFHVAPVAVDGDALRVLVTDPIDLTRLEALATALGLPIQPFVVTEYQFHVHRERLYGIPTPSRYAMLAKRAAPHTALPTQDAPDSQVRTTTAFSTDAVARVEAERARQKQPTPSPTPPPQAPVVAHDAATAPTVAMAAVGIPEMPPLGLGRGDARAASPPDGVVRAPWRTTSPPTLPDATPLLPKDASRALLGAEDRDAVFSVLVRAIRARTSYAALLTVQSDTAFGRVAAGDAGLDLDGISRVAVPLTSASAFRHVVDTRSPYIGTVAGQNLAEKDALLAMGGVLPPSALLLPIVIRERVVALVYAHRGVDPLPIGEIADLLPLAGEAALALSKLILAAKAQGYRKPDATTARSSALSADELPTKKKSRHSWAKAMPSQAPPPALAFSGDVAFKADLPGDMPRLLDLVEAGTEPAASLAAEEVLLRMEEFLGALGQRFPGKLWIDRYASGGRVARASQHGPLLHLATRAGARVVPVLVDRMNAADREVRYYATLACGEVRTMLAIPSLVARLFDSDYGVRAAALDALIGYPARDIDAALEPVRRALSGDATRARAAAHALGELRDVRSIPELILATDRDHTTAEQARRALVLLTKQDFVTKAKKWRAWWDKNQRRARIEWMLDGLAHSDDEVRLSASEELKRLTGEYFGYHYDLPKREREEARHKWLEWWESTGKRRFLGDAAAFAPAPPAPSPPGALVSDPRKTP